MANSKNIWAATLASDGGSFYRAVLGTTLPVDALATLPAAYKDHGWMGDDGFKFSPKRNTKKHYAFGGEVVKVTQENYEATVRATIYEQNITTFKTLVGDSNVTVSYAGGHAVYRVNWSDDMLPRSTFVQRYIDGNKTALHVIEEGQIVSVDDISFVQNELVKFTVEIDCFKSSSGNPSVYTLIDDPDDTGSGS
jgi:hypothetical protein